MLKQASLKSCDSGGDGFKVTKQTQLTVKQKKTTIEELANPLPVAETTLQKLQRFKFPAKRKAEVVSTTPRDIGSDSNSQESQVAKKSRITEYDQRFVERKLQSLNCDEKKVGSNTAKGIESQAKPLKDQDEDYLASDEESLPSSQVLNVNILGKQNSIIPTAIPPIFVDLTGEPSGPFKLSKTASGGEIEETSQYFPSTPRNARINATLLKKAEGLVQKYPDIKPNKQISENLGSAGQNQAAVVGQSRDIQLDTHPEGKVEVSSQTLRGDDDDEYGSDVDMDELWAEDLGDLGGKELKPNFNDEEDEEEYDGWDAEMNEAVMNSPMELANDSPMTMLLENESDSDPVEDSDYGGGWMEGMLLDSDDELEFLGSSTTGGPKILAKPVQPINEALKQAPIAQKAPFKPQIVKEIASPDGSNLYCYKPVEGNSGHDPKSPMIESKGFSLMPASAFESKQNKETPQMTGEPMFQKAEPNGPTRRPGFEVAINKRIRETSVLSSSPPLQPYRQLPAPRFGKPGNTDFIDLTSESPANPVTPLPFRRNVKEWINQSEPLESSPPTVSMIRLPTGKMILPKPKIIQEEPPSDMDEQEEEDEEPAQVMRSWRKNTNYKMPVQNEGPRVDEGFGKFNNPKEDDGYSLPPYCNMKYIPDWKVRRYFEIISTPPSAEAYKKNIVDTRPPPERPMVDIMGERETFFKLTTLRERCDERNLGQKAMRVELFVRVIEFKTVRRGHEVLLTDLKSPNIRLKGGLPVGKISLDSLSWAQEILDPNGQPAAVVGSVRMADGELFIDISHMLPRTWPEITEAWLEKGDL